MTEARPNAPIRYEVAGAGAVGEMRFAPGPDTGATEVREVMTVPLGRVGRAALALTGRFPAREVPVDPRGSKQLLETGRVADTRHAVRGEFGRR